MRRHVIVLAGALSLPSSAAFADRGDVELGGFAGIHLFNDDNEIGQPGDAGANDPPDDSVVFGVRVGRYLASWVSAEGELAIAPATTRDAGVDVVHFGWRLQGLYHPMRFVDERLEPFALLGLGGATSASSDEDVIRNDTDFVVHGGLGVRYRVGDDWGVRLDARLLLPPSSAGDFVTTDGELLIGLYRTFGAPAPAPATADTPAPAPGDADGDGLADDADACPGEAEDADGRNDQDGCPDVDDDGDGIADAQDRCAAEPETFNSYEDDDGCADEVPAQVEQFTGAIEGIQFKVDSAELTAGSSGTLDAAAKVLAEYPALKLEIGGHTDATGDAAYNRDLSQRRAESVKAYLVGKGVAAGRLSAVGYGADRGIADNATAQGRAKNRRVEFVLVR